MWAAPADFRSTETHLAKQLLSPRQPLFFGPTQQPRNECDILLHSPMREQTKILDYVAGFAAQLDRIEATDVLPVEPDDAAGGIEQTIYETQRGSFSGAATAKQHQSLTAFHVEVDGFEDLAAVYTVADIAKREIGQKAVLSTIIPAGLGACENRHTSHTSE